MKYFYKSEKGYYNIFYPSSERSPLPDTVAILQKLNYSGPTNMEACLISREDAITLGLEYSVIWIEKE